MFAYIGVRMSIRVVESIMFSFLLDFSRSQCAYWRGTLLVQKPDYDSISDPSRRVVRRR